MKTYKEFNEAAALAIPAASKLAIPALGGILKGVKAITNRETGLSDSEKKRVGELMDMIKRKKQREKTQKTEKDILDYGREKEGIAERPKKQNAQAQVKEENKHRDAKLFYQYKRLQDPQKPVDPVRALKLKKA